MVETFMVVLLLGIGLGAMIAYTVPDRVASPEHYPAISLFVYASFAFPAYAVYRRTLGDTDVSFNILLGWTYFIVAAGVAFYLSASIEERKLNEKEREERAARAALAAAKPPEPVVAPETEPEKFSIPYELKFEHTLICGYSGAGKTTFLSHLILQDIKLPQTVVVFDSHGDIIEKVLRLDIPRSRIVYINPLDIEYPLSLGLFDFDLSGDTPFERQRKMNSVIETLTFVLKSLSDEMTSKQDVVFQYLVRLCLVIPNANIKTLLQLLNDPELSAYSEHIAKLPEQVQEFLLQRYKSTQYRETREQVGRRIDAMLANDTLREIFGSTKTKLNMGKILDEGSVVLINTGKNFLKDDGSKFFTRFMVSLITQAIQERDPLNEDNMPVITYIDEAGKIMDENTETILRELRKYRLGLNLVVQGLADIPVGLEEKVLTNTSIKIVGKAHVGDAVKLGKAMGVRAETIMGVPKYTFIVHARGATGLEHGFMSAPQHPFAGEPKRSDLKDLIAENRAKYCIPIESEGDPTSSPLAEDDIEAFNKA